MPRSRSPFSSSSTLYSPPSLQLFARDSALEFVCRDGVIKMAEPCREKKNHSATIFDPLFDLGVPTILAIFSSQPFHRSNRELITRPFSNSNNYFLRSRRGSNRGGWVAVPSSPFFFFFLFFVGAVINYYTGQRRKKGRRGRSRSGWRKRELAAREVNRNGKKKR